MSKPSGAAVGVGLVALVLLGVLNWQQPRPTDRPVLEVMPASESASAPQVAIAAPEPGILHPIESPEAAASGIVPAAPADPEFLLGELFGRKSAMSMFQLDEFARRVAATVDSLGRSHAPARLWPMNPADGRFLTEKHGDTLVVSADNALRYTPYVLLIETVDLQQLAAAYVRLYPLFQKAYEELGYPRRNFNDRVVQVLDLLLATPDIEGPIQVRLPAVRGPIQPQRPWVLYEFEDPALQALSAGQKIMLRTGPVNQRRLKVKLAELRSLLATGSPKQ